MEGKNIMSQDFPESPFEPGHPASPDNFKGRTEDITKIKRYLPKVKNQGIPKHFFITGKRGMGKTSFVKYISEKVCNAYSFIPIYLNNDGIESLDEFLIRLIEVLINEFNNENIGTKLFKFVSKYIEGINIEGAGVKLREFNYDPLINQVKNDFSEFLIKISDELLEKEQGIFIFIDDINGLSNNPKFPSWYKRSFDTLNLANKKVPIVFCLVSYPEEFNNLSIINPSFTRIFEKINIDHIDDNDIYDFFKSVFEDKGFRFIGDDGLESMVSFTYGMPLVMQQIGESVFWLAEDKLINKDIALIGVMDAAIEIGNKQIKSKLDKIRSDHHENILLKICSNKKFSFKKSQIKEYLSNDEKNALTDCLARVKDLGIIESIGKENSGEYEFSNRLFFVYFLIKSTFYKFKEKAIVSYGEEFKSGKISQEEFDNKKRMIDKFESNF